MQKLSSQMWSYLLVISRSRKMNFAIKIVVAILLIWVIYKDVNGYLSLSTWHGSAASPIAFRWAWLSVIIVLASVNWALETWKWTLLFEGRKSFVQALRGSFSGSDIRFDYSGKNWRIFRKTLCLTIWKFGDQCFSNLLFLV